MNPLLVQAHLFLREAQFRYAICGGFALDLFLNRTIREHGDLDICVFEKEKERVYEYMRDHQWTIYELQGEAIVSKIASFSSCQEGRTLMCLRDSCELVRFYPCDRGEPYCLHDFVSSGIKAFNYVEFLFNTVSDNAFIFDGNRKIQRHMGKAVLHREGIPFLAPELVLLFKSGDTERPENMTDYKETLDALNGEQLSWFNKALEALYPEGHSWIH